MHLLLLPIIYITFISLGLPDSLIGAAWPAIQQEFSLPLSYAGILTIIIATGTVVSSLNSGRLLKRFGTGKLISYSVATTAFALLGFSVAPSFWILCLLAIPYGLGAGAVDAAINHFVALHYRARHMSWLHCFWGIGASVSPYIMSYHLIGAGGWTGGYRTIGLIQISLTALLFFSLPLWRQRDSLHQQSSQDVPSSTLKTILKIPGVPLVLITFFCYCGIENTAGIWATSYLYLHHGIPQEIAASYCAYFYLGITVGRFFCGFIAEKVGDKHLIRYGSCIIFIATLGLLHPTTALVSLVVLGIGSAPIYPAIVHATPLNFGEDSAQSIIGIEMASAYTGTIFAPALFGLLADWCAISLYPIYLLLLVVLILIFSEYFNHMQGKSC